MSGYRHTDKLYYAQPGVDTKVYMQVRCSENNVGLYKFIPELLYFNIV